MAMVRLSRRCLLAMPAAGILRGASTDAEMAATRARLDCWLENMIAHHRYSLTEAAAVCGLSEAEVARHAARARAHALPTGRVHVLPYPGGRHPRIGFLDGAVDPLRGTKASVFLPWDPASYLVVDLPEAIFTNLGLTFLAHKHIPSKWDSHNLENRDWDRRRDGLRSRWPLPNGIVFGASVEPRGREVAMELWLRNGTREPLTGIRAQVCVMLKGASSFNQQTKENKLLRKPIAAARDAAGERWILTAWEACGRVWENPPVPCIHSDPVFPDCAPGQTVRARGRLWFYEGRDIETHLSGRL